MAGRNTQEVRLGAPRPTGGYAFRAPVTATGPVDAVAPLVPEFVDQGYISRDGVTITTDSGTEKVLDWDLVPVAVIQQSNACSITFTFLQKSPATARTMFGEANVKTTGAGAEEKLVSIAYTGQVLPHGMWAFPLRDGNGDQLLYIPDAQVTSMKGFTLKKDGVIEFEVELELFKDADDAFFYLYG